MLRNYTFISHWLIHFDNTGAMSMNFTACVRWRRLLPPLILVLTTSITWAGNQYPMNPNLSDGIVYVAQHGVARFPLHGREPVWTALQDRLTDAPVVTESAILVGSRSGISALNPESGALLWEINSPMRLFSPSAAQGIAYIGGEDGSLRAVMIASGEQLWRRDFSGWIYPPAIIGDRLVAGGQDLQLRGVDAATGQVLWQRGLPQELVYRACRDR